MKIQTKFLRYPNLNEIRNSTTEIQCISSYFFWGNENTNTK